MRNETPQHVKFPVSLRSPFFHLGPYFNFSSLLLGDLERIQNIAEKASYPPLALMVGDMLQRAGRKSLQGNWLFVDPSKEVRRGDSYCRNEMEVPACQGILLTCHLILCSLMILILLQIVTPSVTPLALPWPSAGSVPCAMFCVARVSWESKDSAKDTRTA